MANISIWGLLMASKSHRDLVLIMQGQTHASLETLSSQLVQRISHIQMANTITLTDKDLSKEGMNNNKALQITMITIGELKGSPFGRRPVSIPRSVRVRGISMVPLSIFSYSSGVCRTRD